MRCCSFCSIASAAKYSFRQRSSQNGATSARRASMTFRGRVLQLTRQRFPIGSRPEPLQNVNLVRVYADEDSLLAAFNTAQNSGRGRFRRGSRKPFETRNILFALGCRRRGAQPRMPRDRRSNASWMHAGDAHVAALKFVAQGLREPTHGKFAGGVRRLPSWSHQSENTRKVYDVRSRLAFQHRQKILHSINHAPEIDINQPAKIFQRYFLKIAVQ